MRTIICTPWIFYGQQIDNIIREAQDINSAVLDFAPHAIEEAAAIGLAERDVERSIDIGTGFLDLSILETDNIGLVYMAKRSDVLPGTAQASTIVTAVSAAEKKIITVNEYVEQTVQDVASKTLPTGERRFIQLPESYK